MKEKIFQLGPKEKRQFKKNLVEILRACEGVEFAYLYGSFTEDLAFHDVDVGVYLAEIEKSETTRQAINLAQMLSIRLKMPIDVRILNFAPVSFLYHVIRGDLIVAKNDMLHSRVVERTVQKYLDLKPIILKTIKEAFTT